MGNIIEKISGSLSENVGRGSLIPPQVRKNLEQIGQKGGEKYSNLVDKLVDIILKK